MIRVYCVVIETDGKTAPIHVMDPAVEAFTCQEAATQIAIETAGTYACEARTIFVRPATQLAFRLATELIERRALAKMPIVGKDGAGAS